MGPLKGIRVLDLSRILAGPWATQLLADYGATIWKIERPEVGDDTRHWGPPFLKDPQGIDTAESAYYLSTNRGKQSIAVDITTESGQAIIRKLVARADILVENFKVGGLEKYGLDYATLSAEHPGLIYCSITGFGQTGPDAGLAGYDAMVQARGGLMSITGERDGLPGAGPQKVGVAVADLIAGMYAVSAILAALHHREKSGEGQQIDLGLLDTQVAWLANQNMNYLIGGEAPVRQGTAHPNIVPYQALPTGDGFLMLAVGNDRQFAACCKVLGQPELARDPRFVTNRQRVKYREQLILLLEALFRQKTTTEWRTLLAAEQVPCGPI
ncbi:CaiB/BaiF CoA transferase family protein, partial [Sedimenticola sp.]|uniref:CaiB/BaiF CoA transferase family protein n=1 Tax=Sedimenticola sp. TaxID=1940285 RepID=UPI002584A47C